MALGARKVLTADDMHELMPLDRAQPLLEGLEKAQAEIDAEDAQADVATKVRQQPGRPASTKPPRRGGAWRLVRMLWRQHGRRYMAAQCILFAYTASKILQPLMLNQLVQFVSSDEVSWHGYLYAIFLGVGALGQACCHHQYFYHSARAGIDVRIALNGLIFRRALSLRTSHMARTTTGQVVNLVSNDSGRCDDALIYMPSVNMGRDTQERPWLCCLRVTHCWASVCCMCSVTCGMARWSLQSCVGCCTSRWAWRRSWRWP